MKLIKKNNATIFHAVNALALALLIFPLRLYAENEVHSSLLNYRNFGNKKLHYLITNVDNYKHPRSGEEAALISEVLHSKITVYKSFDKKENYKIDITLLDLSVEGEVDENVLRDLGPDKNISIEFNRNESGALELTKDSEEIFKQLLKENVNNTPLFGRAMRGFMITRFNLPGSDDISDSTGCYEWITDVEFGMARQNIKMRAFPMDDMYIITGFTHFKDKENGVRNFSVKPEKISAIFKNGAVERSEYRAHVGGRSMIVKSRLVPKF